MLGFIKLHILFHAGEGPVYGTKLKEELARHGYQVSPGTLYPTLHQLAGQGYLAASSEVVAGRARKYYRLTPLGRQVLEDCRVKVRELVLELFPGGHMEKKALEGRKVTSHDD